MDIRIFVSSTFWDFKRERDILVTEILPELREFAWQYGAEVTFVDLRWGLTGEDASRHDIARLCLEEAMACRPLFLGLIGGRYGTVMPRESISMDRLPVDLQQSIERWCAAEMSLTAMEVQHAVLDDIEAANAIFLMRDSALTEVWAKEAGVDPVAWGAPTERSQEALRAELRSVLPGRTRDYASAEEFRALARTLLLKLVEDRIGPLPKIDWLQREAGRQAARTARLIQHYQPDEVFIGHVWTALEAGRSVVLTGPPGRGCSAAAAYVSRRAEALGWQVLITCPEREQDPFSAAAGHLMEMALSSLGREREGSSGSLLGVLGTLAELGPVLVVIDGLARPGEPMALPDWLSSQVPSGVRLLVAAGQDTPMCYGLTARGLEPITVPPLAPEARARVVELVLAGVRKRLTGEQVKRIWSCEAGANPAFLRALLDELIAFGELQAGPGDQDTFIDNALVPLLASPDLVTLCDMILDRVERVVGRDETVRFMAALIHSLGGLQENELAQVSKLDAATVVRLRRAFSSHLSFHSDMLVPKYQALADAALGRYAAAANDAQDSLASWFCSEWRSGRNLSRVHQELPWLLWQAGWAVDLADALVDPRLLVDGLKRSPGSFSHLWASVGDDDLANRALENFSAASEATEEGWKQFASDELLVAQCFKSAGLLSRAGQIFHAVWLQFRSTGGRITPAQANAALDGYVAVVCAEITREGAGPGLTPARQAEIVEQLERAYGLVAAFRETAVQVGGWRPSQCELRIAELERAKEECIRLTEPAEPFPPTQLDPVLAALDRAATSLIGRSGEEVNELADQAAVMRLERLRTRFAAGVDHGVRAEGELVAAVRSVRSALGARPFWHPQRIYGDEVAHSVLCDVGHQKSDPALRRQLYCEASTIATAVLDAVESSGVFVGDMRWMRLLNALETQALAQQNGVVLTEGELARARALLTAAPESLAAFSADVAQRLNL